MGSEYFGSRFDVEEERLVDEKIISQLAWLNDWRRETSSPRALGTDDLASRAIAIAYGKTGAAIERGDLDFNAYESLCHYCDVATEAARTSVRVTDFILASNPGRRFWSDDRGLSEDGWQEVLPKALSKIENAAKVEREDSKFAHLEPEFDIVDLLTTDRVLNKAEVAFRKNYLTATARNSFKDMFCDLEKTVVMNDVWLETNPAGEAGDTKVAMTREYLEVIRTVLDTLIEEGAVDKKEGGLLLLSYCGYSQREIAEQSGMKYEVLRKRLERTRNKLEPLLRELLDVTAPNRSSES